MNIKVLLIALLMPLCAQAQEAPTPKWFSKAQKSIVSIIAYDKKREKIHEGPGYIITADAVAISDYAIFKDAYSAVAVDNSGNQYEVERILGADNAYGLVKYRLAAKKTTPLIIASSTAANRGADVYAVGYTKGKVNVLPKSTIEKKDIIDAKYAYYTLASNFDDKQVGNAIFNAKGELLAIIQSPVNGKAGAVDAAMGRDLSVAAIQSKASALAINNIYIKKGLPDSAEEALVYIFFKSRTASNDEYMDLVNQFVAAYPDNAEGYQRRATPLIDLHRFDEADQDLQTYLKLAVDKEQANLNIAKTIYSKLVYQPEPKYDRWTYDTAIGYVDDAIAGMKEKLAKETNVDNKPMMEARILEFRLQKAQMLVSKGDADKALEIYDEVNASENKGPATFFAASMAHDAAGHAVEKQIEMMDSAIAQFPEPLPQEAATYVMRRARLYQASGQYRKAVADFNTFCYLNNNKVSDTFYYDRSQLETEAKMYQQALDDIDLAISNAPEKPLYYVEKSGLHLRVNQIDECIQAARKCIELDPQNSDAYRILGYAQIQNGDKTSARANLEKAVQLGDETAQEIIDKYLK